MIGGKDDLAASVLMEDVLPGEGREEAEEEEGETEGGGGSWW